MEELSRQVDGYCERVGAGFWAEPVNALTNAAFLVAAFLAWRHARRLGRTGDWAVLALVWVLTAIGIGSFLFHTFATQWAAAADVLPILIFILLYLYVALVRYFGLPRWAAGLLTAAWTVVAPVSAAWLEAATGPMNGSVGYVPTWLLIVVVAGILALRGHPASAGLGTAGGLLAVSLTFRTLDDQTGPVCAAFPLGMHWGWHLLNGTLLGLLIATVSLHGARPAGRVARSAAAG